MIPGMGKVMKDVDIDDDAFQGIEEIIYSMTKEERKNPKLLNVVRNWVMKNDPKIYPKIYEVLATGILEITSPIPKISCPTLVITGDEDFGNGPEMAYAIAAEIPKSKVLILKGLRHMALAEAPDTVNKPIKEFLNEVARVVKS